MKRRRITLSLEDRKKIVDLYTKEKLSQMQCAMNMGCSEGAISSTLKKMNVKRRKWNKSHKRVECNHNYFRRINTQEKAYFLGLLMADGTNYNRGVRISLQAGDKNILEKMKASLRHEGEIRFSPPRCKNCKGQYILNIISLKIASDIATHGVVPRKTHVAEFPTTLPSKLDRHFIRGVFDGDGCVLHSNNKSYFSIVGNCLLIEKIQDILVKECNVKYTKLLTTKGAKENILRIQYGGNKNVFKILSWLYKGSVIHLERKHNIFKKLKSN